MTVAEHIEAYRLQRALQLEQAETNRVAKVYQLNQEIAALEALAGDSFNSVMRAKQPQPRAGICPRCWIDDAVQVELAAIPHGIGDDTPANLDIMRCPTPSCRWEIAAEA